MATRFRDTATGQLLEADTPELEAEAASTPGLERYDLPSPVLFKDTKSGNILGATDLGLAEEADKDPGLRRLTQAEYAEHFAKQSAEERKAVEAQAGREYAAAHPYRTAIGTGLMEALRIPVIGTKAYEYIGGISPEEQEQLASESPIASGAGKVANIGLQVAAAIASGGATGAASAAGRAAATEAAAAGAGRLAQSLAAARAASFGAGAAGEAASPLVSLATRFGQGAEAALTTAAPALARVEGAAASTLLRNAATSVVRGAVNATAATLPLATLNEMDAALREGREFSGESIASQMKLAAVLGGALSSLPDAVSSAGSFFGSTNAGKSYLASLGRSRAERIYSKHAPSILVKTSNQISYPQTVELVNEAAERGLVGEFMNASTMQSKARAAMDESGTRLRDIAAEADTRLGKPININKMWDRVIDDIVAPKSAAGTVGSEETARALANEVESFRKRVGDNVTLRQLWDIRKEIDDKVYGFAQSSLKDPNRTDFFNSFRQMRHVLTDSIGDAVVEAGIPKSIWRQAQRDYQVASHAERIATKALTSSAVKSGMDIPDFLAKAASVGAGLATGSATTGIETMLALSAAKAALPRLREWGNAAVQRAIRTGASPAVIEDLQALSRQQAETAEGIASIVDVKPEQMAINQFHALLDDINQALERPIPMSYRSTLERARKQMADALKNSRRTVRTVVSKEPALMRTDALAPSGLEEPVFAGYDVDSLGNGLQRARDTIAAGSVPTKTAVRVTPTDPFIALQKNAYMTMRELRDNMTAALANPSSMWGEKRAASALDELRRLYAVHTDPARLAKLQALQEVTQKTQRAVGEKGTRLMGVVAGVSTLRRKQNVVLDSVQHWSTEDMKNDSAAQQLAEEGK